MLQTPRSTRGMVTAPHHLAAQAGLAVLREGGNAIEAMIAAASTIAAVYPHMNGLGGDNFWLMDPGQGTPLAIDACGAAAAGCALANSGKPFLRNGRISTMPATKPPMWDEIRMPGRLVYVQVERDDEIQRLHRSRQTRSVRR